MHTYVEAVVLRLKRTKESQGVRVRDSSQIVLTVPHPGVLLTPGQTCRVRRSAWRTQIAGLPPPEILLQPLGGGGEGGGEVEPEDLHV